MAAVPLVGRWSGHGVVLPKGIKYLEQSVFTVLKTEPALVVNWQQFTKHADTGGPMHAENGFLKILPSDGGRATGELLLSHPFAVNEIYACTYENQTLECLATQDDGSFQRGKTAKGKTTTCVKRVYRMEDDDTLTYDVFLGIDGNEPTHHLHGQLRKEAATEKVN